MSQRIDFGSLEQGQAVVVMKVGGELELRADGTPSTGYEWQVDVPALLRLDAHDATSPSHDPELVGAPAVYRWHLTAVSAGSGEIVMRYRRRWEPGAPHRHARVSVLVRNT